MAIKITIAIGILAFLASVGVGLYVTDFTAYMGNNPSTCNNCHVMDTVYEGWYHSAHQTAATCNDCHTPHAFIPKYLVKAESGYHHVSTFLLNKIPIDIRAKDSSKKVVQENCIRCHADKVEAIGEGNAAIQQMYSQPDQERYCFDCHRTVAHGDRGISTIPYIFPEELK